MDSILVTLVVRSVETNEFAVLIRERFKSAQNVVIVLHAYFAPSDEVFPFVFRRIVIGHTENFKSFVMVFVVEFLNVGKRGNAWSAPGGPEINQNNLAFQITQLYFLAIRISIYQVGSRFPRQHGFEGICSVSAWPAYDESKCRDAEIDMAVQVNGKLRGTIHVAADLDDETVVQTALADEKIARFLEKTGGALRKSIVVKNKLVNLIVK